MECIELNWLCMKTYEKGQKQLFFYFNKFSAEMSKTEFCPVSIVKSFYSRRQSLEVVDQNISLNKSSIL